MYNWSFAACTHQCVPLFLSRLHSPVVQVQASSAAIRKLCSWHKPLCLLVLSLDNECCFRTASASHGLALAALQKLYSMGSLDTCVVI